jgi:transposase
MTATMTHDPELDRLRAENARLAAAVTERDAALAALQLTATRHALEREGMEQLAQQLGKDKAKLEKDLAALDHKYQQLCQRLFGRQSEKVDPAQLHLAFAEEEAREKAEAAATPALPGADEAPDGETPETPPDEPPGKKKLKKGHGRKKRPPIERREKVRHDLKPEELGCACCGGQKTSIGSDEITERYDYRPASLLIVEHIRPRYRCSTCQDGTIVAPLPPAPIDRGLAESGLLAYVVASKYADHLPLNRVRGILSREGIDFPRSTLCDWVDQTAGLLEGIADEVYQQVLRHVVVGMDETGIRIVFDKSDKKNGTRLGKIWAYRGRKGEIYFRISETKAHADANGPQVVLLGRTGFVQADADGTFDVLFEDGTRIEVGCNAHARRKFVQAKKSHPVEVAFVLTAFRQVYEIEARLRDATPEARRAARQAETKPILDVLDGYLDALAPTLVPGTPMATAVNYSIRHRVALRRFLDHGELEADNNAVERALRLVAVGRKNWLFAGSENAAKSAAIHYTLVGSCKDLGIEPFEYLNDVIRRVSTHPASRIAELTPRGWLEARRAAEAARAAAAQASASAAAS